METTETTKRIARLSERALKSPSGRVIVRYIERVLADFCQKRDDVRFEAEDCPETDPNCDEPSPPDDSNP